MQMSSLRTRGLSVNGLLLWHAHCIHTKSASVLSHDGIKRDGESKSDPPAVEVFFHCNDIGNCLHIPDMVECSVKRFL